MGRFGEIRRSIAQKIKSHGQSGASYSADISLIEPAYTGESIMHDGVSYDVLDTTRLDFNSIAAVPGKKVKPTLVRIAKPGEVVITIINGMKEGDPVIAQGGEPIFINTLANGEKDTFIPPNGAQVLAERYEFVAGDANGEGATYRPKGAPSEILPGIVQRPTVIKDAWGSGQHQFLDKGATLKQDGARATGIAGESFKETWDFEDNDGRRRWIEQRVEERAALARMRETGGHRR